MARTACTTIAEDRRSPEGNNTIDLALLKVTKALLPRVL